MQLYLEQVCDNYLFNVTKIWPAITRFCKIQSPVIAHNKLMRGLGSWGKSCDVSLRHQCFLTWRNWIGCCRVNPIRMLTGNWVVNCVKSKQSPLEQDVLSFQKITLMCVKKMSPRWIPLVLPQDINSWYFCEFYCSISHCCNSDISEGYVNFNFHFWGFRF